MTDIVNKSNEINSKSITTEKTWKRNCPKCNGEISHVSKKSCYEAVRLNKRCRMCFISTIDTKGNKNGTWNPNRHDSIFEQECPKCHQIIKYTNFDNLQRAIRTNSYCRNCAIEKRDYEKIYTPERRLKMSQKAIERVRRIGINNGICPFFNPKACEYFNRLNEEKQWGLQHALNGGEISCFGYSLDAYDKNQNVVVEYDEPNHYDRFGNLKQKDLSRMNHIVGHLHCDFYRYNEKTNTLKKYE